MTLSNKSKRSLRGVNKKKFNLFPYLNKTASSIFLFNFVFLGLLPVDFTALAARDETENSNIQVAFDSPLIFKEDKIQTIVPGESVFEREQKAVLAQKEAEAAKKRETIAREYRVYADPSNFDEIYAAAGAAYGVDARILQAIHIVETGASGSTSRSNPSGATGPMQFMPSTWRGYGVDGNGDGTADIHNVNDAIYSAAKYLKACGYPNVRKALWGYNPSTSYYNKVMGIAHSLGY